MKGNLLLKFPGDNVRENLKLAMRMCAKTSTRLDTILINHSQIAKLHMVVVLIPGRSYSACFENKIEN